MIEITIKQLRQIALNEMRRKSINESADLTADALAEVLADGIKKQLDGDFAVDVVNAFFQYGQKPGMMFPAKHEDLESLKSQVAQKMMTRLGSELQAFVEGLVAKALKMDGADAPGETNESRNLSESLLPSDYSRCEKCGHDHEYDYSASRRWHDENDDR